jgi:RNA polymerase sigma-70 factor (ECF subfamily)
MIPELDAAIREAQRAWPELRANEGAFREYVLARVPAQEVSGKIARWHVADLLLAYACACRDAAALRAFDTKFMVKVPAFVAGLRQSSAFGDEVRQTLRVKLFVASPGGPARIEGYSGRGPLDRWLRVGAMNTALHILGAAKVPVGSGPEDDVAKIIGPGPNPEVDFMKHRYRADFEEALRDAFAALTPKQRNVLRLHFIDGLSAIAIGAAYGTHRGTATRWLSAANHALLEETRRLLRTRLGLTESEFASVTILVKSGIGVSIERLLRAGED